MSERASAGGPLRTSELLVIDRYREALERIAGPPDRPFLGYDGKLAARALGRVPASPEGIAAQAVRDYDQYVRGVVL